jgi:hypothetical protein
MSRFDAGVASYVIGQATVKVGFPVDFRGNAEIACKHCNFYIRATQRCALNQEIINYPEKYVGANCPLERIDENEI